MSDLKISELIILKLLLLKYNYFFYLNLMDEDNSEESIEDYEILEESNSNYDLSFKIIVIGDAGK
jgi:hypothetical protein